MEHVLSMEYVLYMSMYCLHIGVNRVPGCYLQKFIYCLFQTGKVVSSENDNASNRAAECIAERIEVFKSAFGETEEQLNQEKYVFTKIDNSYY